MERGGSYESPERRRVDLQVMPVGEVHMNSAEKVNQPNLTNVVESVEDNGHDDSHVIVSHLLGECIDVLDDNG